MSLADMLREVLTRDTIRVQYLNECVMGARAVKKTKQCPSHTRVEFATQNMTPNDLLYLSGEVGRPASRKPQFVCVMIWIPTDEYDEFVAREEAKGDPRP